MTYPFEAATRMQTNLCSQSPLGNTLVELCQNLLVPLAQEEVRTSIDTLLHQLETIKDSAHPDDQAVVESMNSKFSFSDAPYLPEPYRDAGPKDNVVEWLLSAPRLDVLRLLTWNVDRQKEHQKRLDQDLPALKERAIAGFDKIADYGLLPWDTRRLSRLAIDHTTVIALDSFEAAENICAGYYNLGNFTMGIANHYKGGQDGFNKLLPSAQRVVTHETGHAIRAISKGGLATINPHSSDKPISTQWFDEALVEHWAQVAEHDEPAILAPYARQYAKKFPRGTYLLHRELANIIMNCGSETIPLELAGEAYIESLPRNKLAARRTLDRKLRKTFADIPELELQGRNIVEVIAADFNSSPVIHADEKAIEWIKTLSRVTGTIWEEEVPTDRPDITAKRTTVHIPPVSGFIELG